MAIILGLSGVFGSLQHGDFAWQFLVIAALGILGEFIRYVMYKNRTKNKQENNENIDKEKDNEKD